MSVATRHRTTHGLGEAASVTLHAPAQSVTATGPAAPLGVLFFGTVAVAAAAWGAAAPFAGPDFGFVADRSVAWQWSVTSACLGLGPGALALVASLWVVGAATRTSFARRAELWALGFVVTACGVWFVVGQYVWPVVFGARFIAPTAPTRFLWEEVTFAIGPGVVLACCGAVFMGWAVRRRPVVVDARFPASEPSAAAFPEPPAAPTGQPPATPTGQLSTATQVPEPPAVWVPEPPAAAQES